MNQEFSENEIINLLNEAYRIRGSDLTKSIELATKALTLSRKSKQPHLVAMSLSKLSLFLMIVGEYEQSKQMAEEAIAHYEKVGDHLGVADAKYNVASIQYKTDNLNIGLMYLLECLATYKKFDDYHNQAKVYKSTGTIYEFFNDQKRAIEAYENALYSARKVNNLNLESNALNPLSGIYLNDGNIEKAFETIEKSIQYKSETGDIRGLAFALYGRGKIYTKTKAYDKAEHDLKRSIRIHVDMGESIGLGMAYIKLGNLYLEKGALDEAISTLKTALQLGHDKNLAMVRSKSSKLLYVTYKKIGDIEKSLYYLEAHAVENELIMAKQSHKIIENYELITKMESLEKEAKLQLEKTEILKEKNIAEQSNKLKQDFLSTMSHEIRTPLNAIITIASLLGDRVEVAEQELIDSLKFSSNNLLQIINDILDFNKLEAGKVTFDLFPCSLTALLQNIRNTYKSMSDEKGIEFKLTISDDLADAYLIDQTKLSQILGNLISNAIKFTDHGYIKMTVNKIREQNGDDVLYFEVQDTGVGIHPTYQKKVFDTFSQSRSVTKRKAGGSGLGLAIVKKLIELTGSQIYLESKVGIGSSFSFELNLKRTLLIKKTSKTDLGELKGTYVLLAEDNVINAMVARKLLSNWGIKSRHAKNGAEAISMAGEERFDFILLDIHMPEVDGFEAVKTIRTTDNLNRDTPVFALTADITVRNENSYSHYFDDFLLKPIEEEKLYNTLKSNKVKAAKP